MTAMINARAEKEDRVEVFWRAALLASRVRGALECIRIHEYLFKRNVDCKEYVVQTGF